jgi:pimeloyl-ACP methyl ester carboxylesterase
VNVKNLNKQKAGPQIPKIVILVGQMLSKISTRLTILYVARLFTTPIKHKMPKRELEMFNKSRKSKLYIESLRKEVVVYEYGNSNRKVLLVHGWSGRGTQLVKFADWLINAGYSTVSFDAPAHGKSSGSRTLMPEFIDCIHEIDKQFGPFEAAIGHSLGGMSLLNAAKRGFTVSNIITIGSGDIVKDIMDEFILKMQLRNKYSTLMRNHFEKDSAERMENYDAYLAAKDLAVPVLVIHDSNDVEVPLKCAVHIHKNLKKGKLMITSGLGHRKILGNEEVLKAAIQFIKNDEKHEKDLHTIGAVGNAVL